MKIFFLLHIIIISTLLFEEFTEQNLLNTVQLPKSSEFLLCIKISSCENGYEKKSYKIFNQNTSVVHRRVRITE